jgi:hypothetical protein
MEFFVVALRFNTAHTGRTDGQEGEDKVLARISANGNYKQSTIIYMYLFFSELINYAFNIDYRT